MSELDLEELKKGKGNHSFWAEGDLCKCDMAREGAGLTAPAPGTLEWVWF